MSTRYVVTECCTAPVVLSDPDTMSLTVRAICARCRAEVGTPGVEDGLGVSRFVQWAQGIQWRLAAEARAAVADPQAAIRAVWS
jgi:hypothetical protein